MRRQSLLAATAGLLSAAAVATVAGQPPSTRPAHGDWPMRGGWPSRNAVSTQSGIPHTWDLKSKKNVKWVAPLGTYSYAGPVIAGGKVYVGTNNAGEFRPHSRGDKGCLLCFDEQTGELLWQATHDKLPSGAANDWPEQGVASTPLVEADRVYYVSNRCQLVCADAEGFRDGENDGPLVDEKHTGRQDADFVWILDMIGELGVFPHNLAACSPVGAGELIFVCTGNGVDEEHQKPPAPRAPSFIAVNKKTGKVVWRRNDPGQKILHGQWSSPAYGLIDGRPQVIFGGGDGWCYAFEPLTGEPIWRFNLNPKDAIWDVSGTGTKTSIVATPVIHDNQVFLAVGDDPESTDGDGHLYAIDATGRGDITTTGRVWHVGGREFRRTLSSVVIADGRLYAADLQGYLSCLDVKTGKRHWRYDMEAAVWGSPCIVDGKVMLGNTDGEVVVLQHSETMQELARNDMRHAVYTTPAAANGVLYIVTPRFLYAIEAPAQWLQWGGPRRDFTCDSTGLAHQWPTDGPRRLWSSEIGSGHSTILVDGDTLYTMCRRGDRDAVLAFNATSGEKVWETQYDAPTKEGMLLDFGPGPHSTPLIVGERIFTVGAMAQFHCFDKRTGEVLWSHDLMEEMGASHVMRGYGASPIAYGDMVILNIGGSDAGVAAFKQDSGELVWQSERFRPGHSSPILVTFNGEHHLIVALRGDRVGLDPATGKTKWRTTVHSQSFGIMATPLWIAPDTLFCSAGYGGGSRLFQLAVKDGKYTVEELWHYRKMQVVHGSMVRIGGHVYGCHAGSFGPAFLMAIDLKTGRPAWRRRGFAKANVLYADGKLLLLDEEGWLALATATPEGLDVLSKAKVLQRLSWTAPTLVGTTLYLRDNRTIMALDLSAAGNR